MDFVPKDSTQTLILIPAPPDPYEEDVTLYESKILDNLPGSSASIRLARVDGNVERALSLVKNVLREQRNHCWMDIHSGLIRSLRFEPYEGDPKELSWDIPKDSGVIDRVENLPSRDESLELDLGGRDSPQSRSHCAQGEQKKRS